jgi:HAD superfamily hydrolase (TIGR01509 family)
LADASEGPVVIFDCNGVLVDSEPIASAVLADALRHAGVPITVNTVARQFHGRRNADIFAAVEKATKRRLPLGFADHVTAETLRRFRDELCAVPHAAYALSWLRGPKAVASSSSIDRIRASLEVTNLLRFFESRLFSASDVAAGKPAPDLFLQAAASMEVDPAECIVIEDSVAGVVAAGAAGMTPIGFIGGSHASGELARDLSAAGAHTVIADMRALKGAVIDLRGW